MTEIPKVTIAQRDGGWAAACDRPGCGFVFFHVGRPVVDEQAAAHQRSHMKGGRP